MSKGLFDDVPLHNPDRDKAWEKIIKRKDMKAMMKKVEGWKFPLDGSYDLWRIAWNMAWTKGYEAGWDSRGEWEKEKK